MADFQERVEAGKQIRAIARDVIPDGQDVTYTYEGSGSGDAILVIVARGQAATRLVPLGRALADFAEDAKR